MRIDNSPSIDTLAAQNAAGGAQKIGPRKAQVTNNAVGSADSDQATLSSASNLLELARNAISPARQAKISALTQQVQSGAYQGGTSQAGKAIVQELLQPSTSAAH